MPCQPDFRMTDAPRLFLITPPVTNADDFAPLLATAVGAAEVACVLLRTAARDDGETKAIVKALAPIAQDKGAALLLAGDQRLAARTEADGLHVAGAGPTLSEALAALQPKKIVGVGALVGRDAAMVAGESGADYVMFGGPDDPESAESVLERAGWWAEIFNVPCVAYAHRPDLVAALAATGVEFVALCDGLWDDQAAIAAIVRGAADSLAAAARLEVAQ
jgi:thiamine-phosphate pyrophosphorylase